MMSRACTRGLRARLPLANHSGCVPFYPGSIPRPLSSRSPRHTSALFSRFPIPCV